MVPEMNCTLSVMVKFCVPLVADQLTQQINLMLEANKFPYNPIVQARWLTLTTVPCNNTSTRSWTAELKHFWYPNWRQQSVISCICRWCRPILVQYQEIATKPNKPAIAGTKYGLEMDVSKTKAMPIIGTVKMKIRLNNSAVQYTNESPILGNL